MIMLTKCGIKCDLHKTRKETKEETDCTFTCCLTKLLPKVVVNTVNLSLFIRNNLKTTKIFVQATRSKYCNTFPEVLLYVRICFCMYPC